MLTFYLSLIDAESDRRSFEVLYNSYRKQMLAVARSVLSSDSEAEDIVHDVFVKIASKHMSTIKTLPKEEDVRNYLLKATKNTALNHVKKRSRDNLSLNTVLEFHAGSTTDLTDEQFLDMVFAKLEHEKLINALCALDLKYREVIYYHFVLEMPVPKVSEVLNRKPGTVKMQLVRGKKLLLSQLGYDGESDYGK